MINFCQGDSPAGDLGPDLFGGCGPDEGCAFGVVGVEVFLDLCDEVGDGVEHTATKGFVGELPEPSFDEIEPG